MHVLVLKMLPLYTNAIYFVHLPLSSSSHATNDNQPLLDIYSMIQNSKKNMEVSLHASDFQMPVYNRLYKLL